jgi:hypothetical protein
VIHCAILKTLAEHMVVTCDTNFMSFMRGLHCIHCFIFLVVFTSLGQICSKKYVVLKSCNHLTLVKVHNMYCFMF